MADIVTLAEVKANLNISDSTHDTELETYIDAVTAHVEQRWGGTLPSGTFTEVARWVHVGDGISRLMTTKTPVLTVTSITDGTSTYTTGFTITADNYIEHDNLFPYSGSRWTIVYTAGYSAMPANLKLAALEDIRVLYQPGQIGPPAAFGQFGIESTEVGDNYRPVRMWPRVDAWLKNVSTPALA